MGGPGGASQRWATTKSRGPFFALFSFLITTDPSPHVHGNSNACEGPNDNTPGQMTRRRANRQPSTQIDHTACESTTQWAKDDVATQSTTRRANQRRRGPINDAEGRSTTQRANRRHRGQSRDVGPLRSCSTEETRRRDERGEESGRQRSVIKMGHDLCHGPHSPFPLPCCHR